MGSSQYTQGSEDGEVRPRSASRVAVRSRPGPAKSPTTPRRQPGPGPGSARPASSSDAGGSLFQRASASSSSPGNYMPGVPAFPGYQSANVKPAGAPTVRPPPPANMVTASQEQRGISHGAARSVQVMPDSSQEIPVRNRRRTRTVYTGSEQDPYQLQVDLLEAKRDEDDPDYVASDVDTQTQDTYISEDAIEPEVLSVLQTVEVSGSDIRSETMDHDASRASAEVRESTPSRSAPKRAYVKDDDDILIVEPDLSYRERLILEIKSNWSSDQLWPPDAAPKGTRGEILRPEEVSEEMLLLIEQFSCKTRGCIEEAHAAIRKAYVRRTRRPGQPNCLLPEDLRAASEQIASSPKRPRVHEDADDEVVMIAGPSSKRTRRSVSQQEERRPRLQPSTSAPSRVSESVNVPVSPPADTEMVMEEVAASDSSTESDTQSLNNTATQPLSPSVQRATLPMQPSASFPVSPATARSAVLPRNGGPVSMMVAAEPEAWDDVADELREMFERTAKRAKTAGQGFVWVTFSLVPMVPAL